MRVLRLTRMFLEEPELYLFLSKCETRHRYIFEFRKMWCSLRDRFREFRYDKQMHPIDAAYRALWISPSSSDSSSS